MLWKNKTKVGFVLQFPKDVKTFVVHALSGEMYFVSGPVDLVSMVICLLTFFQYVLKEKVFKYSVNVFIKSVII